jgi:hypothetical protein
MPANSGAITGTVAHKHSLPSSDGSFLEEGVTGWTGGLLGEVLTNDGTDIPVWQALGGGALQLLQYRLPQESTETVSLNQLYRLGSKDWKVTQTEKPILFEADDDSDLSAVNDDMSGYSSDAEFDAVWVSTDATNLSPDASNDRINFAIPDGSEGVCTFDIGHTIANNSVWSLTWSIAFSNAGTGSRNKKFFFGLTDTTANFTSSQHAAGFFYDDQSSVPSKVGIGSAISGGLEQVSSPSFSVPGDSTPRRYVLNGWGFGRFSCTMYVDMNFGKNYEEQTRTFTWSNPVSNLRYIKLGIWSKVSGGSPSGYLSNVQFTESDQSLLLGKAN